MKKSPTLHWASLLVLYTLVFLMLYEWLEPISELTGTGHLPLIVAFVILCFATNLITIWPAWCNTVLKIGFIGFIVFYIHGNLDPAAIPKIFDEFVSSAKALLTLHVDNIADSVRTFIFLVLLWMTIYLIHHWLTVRYSIFLFFFMTIFFLASIDTFTEYDATYPLIRVMCVGFFLVGMLFIEKVFVNHHMQPTLLRYIKLMVPLLLMIVVSSAFAYVMPKSEPAVDLPAPIAAINDWVNKQLTPTGKIGYVEDDTQLGGSFELDDTPVFDVWAKEPQYLRVDTKYIYTGKGWERKNGDIYVRSFDYDERVPLSIKPGPTTNNDTMTIEMHKQYQFLAQPYGLRKIESDDFDNNRFYVELDTEKIRPTNAEQRTTLENYSMRYSTPVYKLSDLNKTSMHELESLGDEFDKYLQLPQSLPRRVRALAHEITKDETSVYDKTTAIESYFSVNGFRYSRDEVDYPEEGQDYVDQFLFDTKVGYCDNFSTAMVVMLRTQGIPARWVKGFSEGDVVDSTRDTTHFEVTNNNAHSWVEAYMPGVGWMQFEPTIGFSGFDQVEDDTRPDNAADASADEEAPKAEEEKKPTPQQQEQQQQEQEQQAQTDTATTKGITWWPWLVALVLLVVAYILWRTRIKWIPRYIETRYATKSDVSLEQAYSDLLKVLAMHGLKKADGETLQQFAKRVDAQLGEHHMKEFVAHYERYIYDPSVETMQWDKLKESWQYLINKVRG